MSPRVIFHTRTSSTHPWVRHCCLVFLHSMSGNPDSGNKSGKSLLVEYRIQESFTCGIWNPGLWIWICNPTPGIWNPTKDWNSESKFHWQWIGNPWPRVKFPSLFLLPYVGWFPICWFLNSFHNILPLCAMPALILCNNYIIILINIILYYIISYHIISYHIISYIISYHIISYHISYHIISYHIISYYIIPYNYWWWLQCQLQWNLNIMNLYIMKSSV